jgi:hypothetical protein
MIRRYSALVSTDKIDSSPNEEISRRFNLDLIDGVSKPNTFIKIVMLSTLRRVTLLPIKYNTKPVDIETGVIYAAGILMLLYVLIIFEVYFSIIVLYRMISLIFFCNTDSP